MKQWRRLAGRALAFSGAQDDVSHWEVILTGGFDLIRPTVHGSPVLFHPNSLIES